MTSCVPFRSIDLWSMPDDRIYLDHHATTPCDPRVLDAMWPWFAERVGNASSISHTYGTDARDAVENARLQVARSLGAQPEEIIFTSGATEANNLAIKGLLHTDGRPHLIVNAAEHRAVLDPVRRLKRGGCDVTILPVDRMGRVDPQSVADAIRPETTLVSVMAANNEVGTLNPVAAIARVCAERNVLFHCDAAQAVGHIPLSMHEVPIDLMSFTAHKLYGPQGVGALFVRRRDPSIPLRAQLDGGGHERRLRSGTLPVALIVGFGEACRIAPVEMREEAARLQRLRHLLDDLITTSLEDVMLNGCPDDRLPGNLHLSFGGVDGGALLARLDGLAVSSGSACTTANPEPSHVLRAMGVPETLSLASLRFGIGRFTTETEIERAAG
ncbi:MAG: cysteine desulfurase, partial [Planctomycetaceae bacterium]|nr:cysteine desulfurase [Planctomycetaceae bacterium]